MSWSEDDQRYMARAIALATKGLYTTNPNPRVGCVLVKGGVVIGEGYHHRAGEGHAEIEAFNNASTDPQGCTVYVTLEPCSHFGKTPPCVDKIIAMKAQRVVCAMVDPNPLVAGKSIEKLKNHDIQVECGLLEREARDLNPGFIKRMSENRPFVRCKLAMSLDGKTAMSTGESQWISNAKSRDDVQHWRARSSAIITGINTVICDNAKLNVRQFKEVKQPIRVVLDSRGQLSANHALCQVPSPIIWVTKNTATLDTSLIDLPQVTHWVCESNSSRIDLGLLLKRLNAIECNEVLVEAGPTLAGQFLKQQFVDELVVYIAPKILGHQGRPLAIIPGLDQMKDAINWKLKESSQLDNDLRLILTPIDHEPH